MGVAPGSAELVCWRRRGRGRVPAEFGRPVIEQTQIARFVGDLNDWWGEFWNWSQLLWTTIDAQAAYQNDLTRLVSDVFNHDKGYNRAINFAQAPSVAAVIGPPTLAEAMAKYSRPDSTSVNPSALWIYQCLYDAGLISQAPTRVELTNAVTQDWQEINAVLGYAGDAAQLLPLVEKERDDMSMIS